MKTKILMLIMCLLLIFSAFPVLTMAAQSTSKYLAANAITDNSDPAVDDNFDGSSSSTSSTTKPTESSSSTSSTTKPTESSSSTSSTTKPTESSSSTSSTTKPTTTQQIKINVANVKSFKAVLQSTSSVKLSWGKSSNATSYKIYKTDGNYKIKYYKTVSSLSFTDKGLKKGKTYTYQIIAFTVASGKTFYSEYSNPVKVATLASNVGKVKTTATKNSISFNVSKVCGATGYEVYKGTNKKYTKMTKKSFSSNKFKFTKLNKNTKYYFKIRAYKTINGKKVYTSYKKIVVKTKNK